MSESVFVPEVQAQARLLCRMLIPKAQEYYQDPQHRTEFEQRYLKKHGKPYMWVPMHETKEDE